MSRDIRSFFTVISKKSGTESTKPAPSVPKKKPKRLIDSDDEDVIPVTPETKQKKPAKKRNVIAPGSESEEEKKKSPSKKQTRSGEKQKKPEKKQIVEVLSSDSEEEIKKKTSKKRVKKEEPKLKPVNVLDVFKNSPIKQSKVEVPETPEVKPVENKVKKSKSKKKLYDEKKVHKDVDFNKTLEDLDDDIFMQNLDVLDKTIEEALNKDKVEKKENNDSDSGRKRSRNDSSSDNKTPKKKKIEHTDSGIDPGQEAHEKKRYSAMLYQKYLQRGTPKNQGMKEYPKGKPDCLKNLCFLRTGVLDSLESEGFETLLKEHGGRVVHAVSKKVNYVVVGEDAGPAKLAKADSYNIPTISEDELLDLILTKSGMEPKYCKKDTTLNSDDLGFETDNETKTTRENEKQSHTETSSVEKLKESEEKKKESKSEKFEKKAKDETKISRKDSPEKKKKSKEEKPNDQTRLNGTVSSGSCYSQPGPSKTSEVTKASQKPQLPCPEVDSSVLSLSEKYRPQNLQAVIGQRGDSSNLYKLKHWLENWYKNQDPKVKKTLVRPSPWAKKDDGAYFKSALLSGPPGVGKTTTATLVAKELGLDIVEFNASDTRSKKLLHQEVAQLLSSKTIAGFATGQPDVNRKRVLLMDEVDGMAGNEDRGGIQELIQLIKSTNVPIICMCNDRNHQKMRSLVNYCFDLKFTKPKLEQIKGAMMSICFKENIDISSQALTEVIAGTGCDVRQTLNHLALLASTNQKITVEVAEKESKVSKKDTVMGPWEVCRTVFTKSEHKDMSIADKARLFFFDYSIGPLFVQENYLKVQPEGTKKEALLKAAFAADSISWGDLIDSKIRRSNNWALLESQAFFSSVLPGHYMSGHFTGVINFPAWLGKNSKKNKFNRMASELQTHTRTSASASKVAIKLDYLLPLRNAIISPLKKKGLEGINEAVAVMKTYSLLREDVDNLLELCQWTHGDNPMSSVDSKVKSAFTRAYNKQVTLLPYAPTSGVSKKRAAAAENDVLGQEEEVIVSDDEEDDDISNNVMIKVKKPTAKGKKGDEGTNKRTEKKEKGKAKKK